MSPLQCAQGARLPSSCTPGGSIPFPAHAGSLPPGTRGGRTPVLAHAAWREPPPSPNFLRARYLASPPIPAPAASALPWAPAALAWSFPTHMRGASPCCTARIEQRESPVAERAVERKPLSPISDARGQRYTSPCFPAPPHGACPTLPARALFARSASPPTPSCALGAKRAPLLARVGPPGTCCWSFHFCESGASPSPGAGGPSAPFPAHGERREPRFLASAEPPSKGGAKPHLLRAAGREHHPPPLDAEYLRTCAASPFPARATRAPSFLLVQNSASTLVPARVRGQPFPGRAERQPPPFLLARHSASIPVPAHCGPVISWARVARAPQFLARGVSPYPTRATRAPTFVRTARRGPPLPGRALL